MEPRSGAKPGAEVALRDRTVLKRLRRLDRCLVLLGLPLWLLWMVLHVRAFPLAGLPPLLVSALQDEDEYPKASYFAPLVPVEDSGIRIGDRIRRVGDFDLRGLGSLGFDVRFMEVASRLKVIPIEYERAGVVRVGSVGAIGWNLLWPLVPTGAASLIVGLIVLVRAPRSRVAQASFHVALATAFLFLFASYASRVAAWASLAIAHAAFLLVMPLFLRLFLLFPHGAPPQTWLGRLGPWAGIAFGLTQTATIFGFPYSGRFNTPIGAGARALGFGAALGCLAQLYYRSDSLERRKLRIVVLGVYCAVLPAALGFLWASLRPRDLHLANLSTAAFVVVPCFAYLALYRYDVFDVDRVLGSAVSYNLILFVLVGAGLFLVPAMASAVSSVSGLEPVLGQAIAALALAALVVPGQRVLRPRIEGLLFRERRAIDEGLEGLRDELSASGNPKVLLERVGSRLHELLRPDSTALYASDGETLAAVFVAGRGVAATLEADGPVLATLRRRAAPLSIDGTGSGPGSDLGPFERAALEVLNAAVAVPIAGSDGGVEAILCLGPKRSGDIYTSSELRMLAALADRTALELQRFDQLEVEREGQAMQEALRRYVPGAVAEKLARGEELASEEREVTVLFVDLRGYTSLAEGHRAEEIFSTVNAYTERVSHRIRGAGGSVVEFNGDGMMAVFGAPGPLPEKERAAVRAGRGIVTEVGALEFDGLRLSVGIGIATGEAYVGNIQAADRLI